MVLDTALDKRGLICKGMIDIYIQYVFNMTDKHLICHLPRLWWLQKKKTLILYQKCSFLWFLLTPEAFCSCLLCCVQFNIRNSFLWFVASLTCFLFLPCVQFNATFFFPSLAPSSFRVYSIMFHPFISCNLSVAPLHSLDVFGDFSCLETCVVFFVLWHFL